MQRILRLFGVFAPQSDMGALQLQFPELVGDRHLEDELFLRAGVDEAEVFGVEGEAA